MARLASATDIGDSTATTAATEGGDEVVEVSGDTTVEATVGETVTLSLEANETTGYRWSESVEGAAVRSRGGEYQAPRGGAAGAGGTQLYTYEAVEAGTATVTLTYSQAGSGDVGQTYIVTFDVS